MHRDHKSGLDRWSAAAMESGGNVVESSTAAATVDRS